MMERSVVDREVRNLYSALQNMGCAMGGDLEDAIRDLSTGLLTGYSEGMLKKGLSIRDEFSREIERTKAIINVISEDQI